MTDSKQNTSRKGAGDAVSQGFPRSFGQYLLLHRLARGGMGEVFLAKHGNIAGLEKYCVVKTLRANYTQDREYVTRFIDEARVVVQLNHRNICQIADVGRIKEQYFLAMEFVVGRDLRTIQTRLKNDGLALQTDIILHIGCEVLEALDYAHRHADPVTGESLEVVHRDVSPQNIMINFEGEVKLIDFGLAQSTQKVEKTQPHVVMGKMQYMPPEQARGDPVDARADQFAVAMLLYELLSGERFYEGMSFSEIWQIAGQGGFTPRRLHDLDPGLRAILNIALSPEREERYASCGDFREALTGYQYDQRLRSGSREVRSFMLEVFADDLQSNRELLARFRKVSAIPQTPKLEESQSFARSPSKAQSASAVIPLHPDGVSPEPVNINDPRQPIHGNTEDSLSFADASLVDTSGGAEETATSMVSKSHKSSATDFDPTNVGPVDGASLLTDLSPPNQAATREISVRQAKDAYAYIAEPSEPSIEHPIVTEPSAPVAATPVLDMTGNGHSGSVSVYDDTIDHKRKSKLPLFALMGALLLGGALLWLFIRPDPTEVTEVAVGEQPGDVDIEIGAESDEPIDGVRGETPPTEIEEPSPTEPENPPVVYEPAVEEPPQPPVVDEPVDEPEADDPPEEPAEPTTASKPKPKPTKPKPKPTGRRRKPKPKPKKSFPAIPASALSKAVKGAPLQKSLFLRKYKCAERGASCSKSVLRGVSSAVASGGPTLNSWSSNADKCISTCFKK